MRTKVIALLLTAALVLISGCGESEAGEWIALFDGQTLDGWSVHSGFARYEAVDGAIVGTAVKGSPNTFLCAEKDFGDFILEFEVLLDPKLNSGVQFRSQIASEEIVYWFRDNDGEPHRQAIHPDRVFGYQVEIATEQVGSSGGVYDEARRAFMLWRHEPGSEVSKAFKDGQWNRYRVECRGNSIKTWVNEVRCADFKDSMTARGIIGLQEHDVGDDPTPYEVRWRNIRIFPIAG